MIRANLAKGRLLSRRPFFVLLALGELLHANLFLRFDAAKGRRFEPAVLVEGASCSRT